jgi:integrase
VVAGANCKWARSVEIWQHPEWEAVEGATSYACKRPSLKTARRRAILTIPELEHAKAAALGTLVSMHSRRAYKNAIDKFTAWYCSEPRLGFNRDVVLRYRSFLESLSLSAATINLHLSAIRRLAAEAAESSMLSPELAIGIRRVKGVKRLGRRIGNWLSGDQAQDLLNSIPRSTIRGRRDAALIGLLLGCGLRRSEAVALRLGSALPDGISRVRIGGFAIARVSSCLARMTSMIDEATVRITTGVNRPTVHRTECTFRVPANEALLGGLFPSM